MESNIKFGGSFGYFFRRFSCKPLWVRATFYIYEPFSNNINVRDFTKSENPVVAYCFIFIPLPFYFFLIFCISVANFSLKNLSYKRYVIGSKPTELIAIIQINQTSSFFRADFQSAKAFQINSQNIKNTK